MKSLIAAAFVLASAALQPAIAGGRPPTEEERFAISQSLQRLGFSAWGEIEFDNDRWEIDDALHKDGFVYEVDLAPRDLALLKKKRAD